jgi:hypothetical protein
MSAVSTILPLVLESLKLIPSLVSGGQMVYDGVKEIWEGVTSDNPPNEEEKKKYDDAMEKAFEELMKSTEDVKDKEE